MKLAPLVFLAALASCETIRTDKTPTFVACAALARPTEMRIAWREEIGTKPLPELIPIATVTTLEGGRSDAVPICISRGEDLGADLVLLSEGQYSSSGNIQVVPIMGTNTYGRQYRGVLYRLAPASLGFACDDAGMVVSASASAKKSGMLEGDHVTAVAGEQFLYGDAAVRSPHLAKLLTLKPGDAVDVACIRPGTGLVNCHVICDENPPLHLALTDATIEWKTELAKRRRDE